MSFNAHSTGKMWEAGWFLLHDEECTRLTKTIPANHAQVKTADDGSKYVPMGAIYPSNDANAIGIVYENIDVSTGAMAGSVVTAGTVYLDRLPVAPVAAAKTALEGLGFKFLEAVPTVTRPYN